MKRILCLAFGLLLFSAASLAQTDAKSRGLIDRHNQLSGLDQKTASGSALMEVQVSAAGANVAMKIIKGTENGFFRIEMNVPGQGEILMISDGKNGWVAPKGGPVQTLPKQVIDQMASQGDVSGTLSVDEKNFDYTYVKNVKGHDMIEGTLKADGSSPFKRIVLSFSEASGLLSRIQTIDNQGKSIEISVSGYQKFGDVLMPTRMETTVPGGQNAVITIKNVEFGIPTQAWMFAKPAPVQ